MVSPSLSFFSTLFFDFEREPWPQDLQLQNQLVKFNKFLQDNEAKRRRSETRAHEEGAQIKQKDEEIQDLEKQAAKGF